MCAPSPSGGALVGVLSSPAAVVGVAVVGSGGLLAAMAGGSTILAWAVIGLTAWAAMATIALLLVLAHRPATKTAPAAPSWPAPPQRAPARILHARPVPPQALEAARPQLDALPSTICSRS